jgi:hypothetical protein
VPRIFGFGQHSAHEGRHLVIGSRLGFTTGLALFITSTAGRATIQHLHQVDAHRLEDEIDDDEKDDRADAEPATAPARAAAGRKAEAPASAQTSSGRIATAILDVVGLTPAFPFHDILPQSRGCSLITYISRERRNSSRFRPRRCIHPGTASDRPADLGSRRQRSVQALAAAPGKDGSAAVFRTGHMSRLRP